MTTSPSAPTISPAKLRANRRNARQSTGPKTEAGKARASRNAISHGIFCKDVVLPTESNEAFQRFRHALLFDLRPEGALQQMVADRVVILSWKLNCIPSAEAEAHADINLSLEAEHSPAKTLAFSMHCPETAIFDRLSRYEQRLSSLFHRALRELHRLQQDRCARTWWRWR